LGVKTSTARADRREKILEEQRRHGAVPKKSKMYFFTALGVITVFVFSILLADLMRV
jgi:hypothetical protein